MLVIVRNARTCAGAVSVTDAMSIVETKQAAATTFVQGQAVPDPMRAFGRSGDTAQALISNFTQ